MSAIEIRGAVKNFPGFTLGPIDLTVMRGEFFGIFGPPATGKTSVLKLILGLLAQDEGEVMLDGVDAASLEVSERGIAMVFQNLALFPHMTGGENITYALSERGAPKDEIADRLAAIAGVLRVGHIVGKLPGQMSGGERQRIALGRALASASRGMLLDEPISALDARLREEMRVELKRLQRVNGQTFVYVSHDEEEVMAISDRVAVMIGGRIVQVGTPGEVYDRPNSLAVAEVVGSPPMNLFRGRYSEDGWHFECSAFASPLPLQVRVCPGEAGTLGVRPVDVRESEVDGPGSLPIAVSSVEPLGGYTVINAILGGQLVMIRGAGRIARAEDYGRRITFDPRKLHFFDGDGKRVSGAETDNRVLTGEQR